MKKKASKIGRPAGSTREDTIKRALASARKLFSEKGYSATTLKDIAKDMGVTHSTLYLYFASKEDLYKETINVTQDLVWPDFQAVLNSDLPFKEKLTKILMASRGDLDLEQDRSAFLASVPVDLMRHEELKAAVKPQENSVLTALCVLFKEGMKSGDIVVEAAPEDLVVMFIGGLMGMSVFHQGIQIGSVEKTMSLFVEMIDQHFFKPDDV